MKLMKMIKMKMHKLILLEMKGMDREVLSKMQSKKDRMKGKFQLIKIS